MSGIWIEAGKVEPQDERKRRGMSWVGPFGTVRSGVRALMAEPSSNLVLICMSRLLIAMGQEPEHGVYPRAQPRRVPTGSILASIPWSMRIPMVPDLLKLLTESDNLISSIFLLPW